MPVAVLGKKLIRFSSWVRLCVVCTKTLHARKQAVYHFTFTGNDEVKATVTIRDEKLQVSEGHSGQADLRLTADSQTWRTLTTNDSNKSGNVPSLKS
ncbi:MAG TPA: SCP2 sterol-binding domain-containing protein [Terriglobales bacterium]|nr:SCP2 sterol-binding domain-containing protein [Terriglobales bacterium]